MPPLKPDPSLFTLARTHARSPASRELPPSAHIIRLSSGRPGRIRGLLPARASRVRARAESRGTVIAGESPGIWAIPRTYAFSNIHPRARASGAEIAEHKCALVKNYFALVKSISPRHYPPGIFRGSPGLPRVHSFRMLNRRQTSARMTPGGMISAAAGRAGWSGAGAGLKRSSSGPRTRPAANLPARFYGTGLVNFCARVFGLSRGKWWFDTLRGQLRRWGFVFWSA